VQHGDFVHLVRRSQHEIATNAAAYRRRIAVFAGLPYAWVAGSFALAGGLLAWAVSSVLERGFSRWSAGATLAAAGLLWAGCDALGRGLSDAPPGVRLRRVDAPLLFASIERIRARVSGPPLHKVLLDDDLRVRIVQRRRWGFVGPPRNHLLLGLPVLMALDRQRLLALLAHEYAHLRRGHARLSAWVYRTRALWMRPGNGGNAPAPGPAASTGFLGWYLPRFLASSFALAREDEYEADRVSAHLLGAEVTAAALTEIALKGEWVRLRFWPAHWALAATHAEPVGPHARLEAVLRAGLPDEFARPVLRQLLRRPSSLEDTLPELRERLAGLGVRAQVPAWSRHPALPRLLGKTGAERWIARLDARWCRAHRIGWLQYRAALGRARARIDELRALREPTAAEWTELGDLQRRLDPDAPVQSCYEQALAQWPPHPGALQGLYACLAHDPLEDRLACLELLHEISPAHRYWAAQAALTVLLDEPGGDVGKLSLWQQRLQQAGAAEARAWSELTQQPVLAGTGPPDLSDFERREFEAEMARWPQVSCAWLLRKPSREFPARRCYVVVLEISRMRREGALALCRALEPGLPLPGPALLLWSGESPELREAVRRKGMPLYDARVRV
jgi:hypothetical protein